ncbi:slit homolog 3 protein-like [Ostrinia furnacalis]|uniref:slit homolog 3 protein-like n=1 Tax=Ostrinia furnacalis TaxID=93504 RepID=UPI001040236C|nr:slit homolog 3 protein-like [Ostrinia furnacalis]
MDYRVCVFVFIGLSASLGQEEEVIPLSAAPVEVTPVVCSVCECAGTVIDCSSRGLKETLSQEAWAGMKSLNVTEINLSGNYIETLAQVQIELPIEVFNSSNSNIERVDDRCFKYLPNLTTIDLSGNKLTSIDQGVLQGLLIAEEHRVRVFKKMRYLNLADNELHTLPKDAFYFMQELTFLDLSGNPLGIIDQVVMGALSDLTLLKEFRLRGCELETLPAGLLRRQRRLERLDISDNMFKTVPDALAEATNLIYLDFDKNSLTEISEQTAISKLTKLQELRICRNTKLRSIGVNALGGLESLVTLWICNNPRLSVIDDDFLTWEDDEDVERRPSLKELYLYNNNITEIDSDFLFRWDQLQKMDFSDNPYTCDCHTQWMVDVLVPFIINNGGSAGDMICNKPQELRGLSFAHLHQNSKTLTCVESENIATTAGPADIAIILGVMIGKCSSTSSSSSQP